MRKIFYLAVAILFSFAAVACSSDDDHNRINVGEKIPEFHLSGYYEGSLIDIYSSDFYGKRGIIFFFSTGCNDCIREFPKIEQVWELVKNDETIQMAAISRQQGNETPEAVSKYWSDNGLKMPYYLDHGRQVYDKFASLDIPRLYLLDEQGIIRKIMVERIEYTATEIVSMLRQY